MLTRLTNAQFLFRQSRPFVFVYRMKYARPLYCAVIGMIFLTEGETTGSVRCWWVSERLRRVAAVRLQRISLSADSATLQTTWPTKTRPENFSPLANHMELAIVNGWIWLQRREVPWHKVPTVPRPSQVPLPFTVYGSKHTPVSSDGAVYIPRHSVLPERTHRRIRYTTLY